MGQRERVLRTLFLAIVLLLGSVVLLGCRQLPDTDVDDATRVLRRLDQIQRPTGGDLPVERFLAWNIERRTGERAAEDQASKLHSLVDEQKRLLDELRGLRVQLARVRNVLSAYVDGHSAAYHAMEEARAAHRLADPVRLEHAEEAAKRALQQLRKAQSERELTCNALGIVLTEAGKERP